MATDKSLKYRNKLLGEQLSISGKFRKLIANVGDEVARLVRDPNIKFVKSFDFSHAPVINAKLGTVITSFHGKALELTENEIKEAWNLSNLKNNEIVDGYLKGLADLKNSGGDDFYFTNTGALKSFIARERGTETLSDAVWATSKQLRREMELQLGLGIANGDSADTISRRIRNYLQNPDTLFRMVKDVNGNQIPSKAMAAYHPGQGVYKSAYKNALRVTRTEMNQAYLMSDWLRWQDLPFVTGISISLSDQHPDYPFPEICEELEGDYPKDFLFVGWHPQCLCHAVPIMMQENNFRSYLRGDTKNLNKVKQITEAPESFKNWIEGNYDRVSEYKSVPYFIQDNPEFVKQVLKH